VRYEFVKIVLHVVPRCLRVVPHVVGTLRLVARMCTGDAYKCGAAKRRVR
jgi:hypothetical protein